MFQAIQTETQAEQQGLAHLHAQRPVRRSGAKLTLHRREDALDQSAASIEPSRIAPTHLDAESGDRSAIHCFIHGPLKKTRLFDTLVDTVA